MRNQRLLNLFKNNLDREPAKGRGLWSVRDEKKDEATVYVYDMIDDYWGISSEDYAKELNNITASTIHLRIDSPGGDVFPARAMHTVTQQHPSKVIAHIDGLAASAASFLAMGADEIEAVHGGALMIHNALSFAYANAKEMREIADLLDQVSDTIVYDYCKKTGLSEQEIKDYMDKESWFFAEKALELGFIDRIYDPEDGKQVENRWDLSAYDNVPKNLIKNTKNADPIKPVIDRATMKRRLNLLENFGR